MHVASRSGGTVTPSGEALEVGVGGADILGRLSWQALASLGDAAGPRGAGGSVVWRGARWAPELSLFTALERPSAQRFVPITGFDRQRTGGALTLTYESKGVVRLLVRPAVAAERLSDAGREGGSATRVLAGVDATAARTFSRGESWGITLSASGTAQAGRTAGEGWTLARGAAVVAASTPAGLLRLRAEAGRVGGDPAAGDLFHLGGVTGSLVPAPLDAGRVAQAALPSRLATGDRFLGLRASFGGAARVYLEHAAVWGGGGRPPFTRVAGLEVSLDGLLSDPALAWRAGRLSLTLGLHRPLDGAMRNRTVATLTAVVTP